MNKKTVLISVFCIMIFLVNGAIVYALELTLAEGLKLAVDNSRLVKIAERDEEIAFADTLIEKSRMLPSVNAQASGTALSDQPGAIFGQNTVPIAQKDFLAYSITVQHTLYDFMGNVSRYEASRKRMETKALERLRTKNLVAVDFALTYLDLLESQKMLSVAQKEVERFGAHARDVSSLLEEGVVTKNDLLQAEVRLSDANQRLLSASNIKSLHAARVNNLLGRPLGDDVRAVDGLSGPSLPTMEIGAAWETALGLRPEIKMLEEARKALDLEETARKSEYYPRLFIRGGYDFTENRYQVHDGNWSMTVGLGMNIFSGGSTSAELSKISAQRSRLVEQKNKLLEDIRLEINKYMLDLLTAQSRIKVTTDSVRQAEENLRINKARYEEGVGTATEVLDAVTLLTLAETNYYRSVYDAGKAEAAVLYSIGKDLTEVYK